MGEQLKSFWNNVKAFASGLWTSFLGYLGRVTAPVVSIGLLAGIVFLVAKYKDFLMDYIGWSAKKELKDAVDKDAALKKQEDEANAKADQLVSEADKLSKQGAPDDWYKKK